MLITFAARQSHTRALRRSMNFSPQNKTRWRQTLEGFRLDAAHERFVSVSSEDIVADARAGTSKFPP